MKNILKSLLSAKLEIMPLVKDSTNPHFKSKYFDINSLLENIEPLLFKNGLIVLQPIVENKIKTTIYHVESGESIESVLELPNISEPQKIGGAITYYRRYTLQSLLSLQAEDEDANVANQAVKDMLNKPKESNNNHEPQKPVIWLNRFEKDGVTILDDYKKAINKAKLLGYGIDDLKKIYSISKNVESYLTNDLKNGM